MAQQNPLFLKLLELRQMELILCTQEAQLIFLFPLQVLNVDCLKVHHKLIKETHCSLRGLCAHDTTE